LENLAVALSSPGDIRPSAQLVRLAPTVLLLNPYTISGQVGALSNLLQLPAQAAGGCAFYKEMSLLRLYIIISGQGEGAHVFPAAVASTGCSCVCTLAEEVCCLLLSLYIISGQERGGGLFNLLQLPGQAAGALTL
jgi:hypothetical protein